MIDCYRILGVNPSATAAQIRVAYLAKMKALHPDARLGLPDGSVTASEVTLAYWQLRDPSRRARHDAELRVPVSEMRPMPAARRAKNLPDRKAKLSLRARRRRDARLQPVRRAAGAVAFGLAAVGFVLAFTYLQPPSAGGARAATLSPAPPPPASPAQQRPRRKLDRALAQSAAREFELIMRSSGLDGAQAYGRQCHAQLAAQPSLSMLDYCIAFDDVAAEWERTTALLEADRRYFGDEQRFARYRSLSDWVRDADVRKALADEVRYFSEIGT
jgi:curved DNA-binding protein CbpA